MGTGNQKRNYLEEINLLKYNGSYPLTIEQLQRTSVRYFEEFYENYKSNCKQFWFDIQIGEKRYDKKHFGRLQDLVDWINNNVPNDGSEFTEHRACVYPYYIEDQNIRPIMFLNGFNRVMASLSGRGKHRSGVASLVDMHTEYTNGAEIIQKAFQDLLGVSITTGEAVKAPYLKCMWKSRAKRNFFRTPKLHAPAMQYKSAIHFSGYGINSDRFVYDKVSGSARALVNGDFVPQDNCGYIDDYIVAISTSDSKASSMDYYSSNATDLRHINREIGSRENVSAVIIARVNLYNNVYALQVYPLGIDSFILNLPDLTKYDVEVVTEAPFMRQELRTKITGVFNYRIDEWAMRMTFGNAPLLNYLRNESIYPAAGGKVSYRFRVIDKVTGIVSPLSKSKIVRTYNPKRTPQYQYEIQN